MSIYKSLYTIVIWSYVILLRANLIISINDELIVSDDNSENKIDNTVKTNAENNIKDPSLFVKEISSFTLLPFIRSNKYTVINFYINGCHACAEFSQHFLSLAESIKTNSKDTSLISFGQVNCRSEESLCANNNISNYPSVIIYREFDPDNMIRYKGENKRYRLEKFLRIMLDSVSISINSINEIEELLEYDDVLLVYNGNNIDEKYRYFSDNIASKNVFDKISIYYCNFNKCSEYLNNYAKKYGYIDKINYGDVVILKNFDEQINILKDGFNFKDFSEFVSQKYYIDIHPFDSITYFMTFDRLEPSLYLFKDRRFENQSKILDQTLKNLAPKLKTKLKLVTLGINEPIEEVLSNHYNISEKDLPLVIIFNPTKARSLQYRLYNDYNNTNNNGEIKSLTEEGILDFANKYLSNKLEPVLKSERFNKDLENNSLTENEKNMNIKYVSGSNFLQFVNISNKDVVIFFYTDECNNCKEDIEIYYQLIGIINRNESNKDNIIFGKFNYSKNETKEVYADKYPTLVIWPSENKKDYSKFDQEFQLESILNFVISSSSNPIVIHDDL